MNFIKNIICFLKKVFHKENNIKMIEGPIEIPKRDNKANFINSLKVNTIQKKKKIDTLICYGDGLGMQNKISY